MSPDSKKPRIGEPGEAGAPDAPPAAIDVARSSVDAVAIDGSMLEGGGQILRNSASLAAITGTPISVDAIRAGRSKPGLRPQHLAGLELVASLCGGRLNGGQVGSTAVTLTPGRLRCCPAADNVCADTGTAGSCMLLAQVALPCLLFAPGPSTVELRGGTDAAMAPPVDYSKHVLLPMLRRLLGVEVDIEVVRRGFFPRGGGVVRLTVAPVGSSGNSGAVRSESRLTLPPMTLTDCGELEEITIYVFTAGRVKPNVGERMAAAATATLAQRLPGATVRTDISHEPPEAAFGDGCGLVAVARTSGGCLLGASALGEKRVTAEEVGQRAAEELADVVESKACVDNWLMDQLVVFMALAAGQSEVVCREPTLHTRTAVAVAERLTGATFDMRAIGGGGDGGGGGGGGG